MIRVQPQHSSTSSDENKETANTWSVLHILNPVVTWMRVCGVCTGPTVSVENLGCSDNHFRQLHKDGWLHILYCVLRNTYLWIFSGILAYKLAFFKPMSSEWIILFLVLTLNVSSSGCCTWFSLNYRNGIYQCWVKSFYLYEQCYGVHENMKVMVQKGRILVAFVISIGICIPWIILTYALVVPEVGHIIFVLDKTLGWWNYILTTINYFFFCTSLSCSVISAVIGSYPLCSELDVINTIMTRCVEEYTNFQESQTISSKSASDTTEKLKATIRRHKHISCLISGYGDAIAYFQFIAFFISLPLSCFSLYVIMTRMESSNVTVCACILFLCSVSCIVLSVAGVRVNVKAHSALQYMFKIPTENLDETTMRAVNHFTSLLTGTTIGFNVYGLFTMSPPTILSIVGTFVTYIVVVLQFRSPDSQTSPDDVCQDLVANVTLLLDAMRNSSFS